MPPRGEPAALSTPIRRQYLDLKARRPDAILFFRLGDFYETFDEDARLVSEALGIALTSKPMGKGQRVPLAGVPVKGVEGHLSRLIAAGHRVAVAEQLEDPRASKGLVARGIVRVLSPGTALEPALLEAGRNTFCAALALLPAARGAPARAGLAAADLSTGEFRCCELEGPDAETARAAALDELSRLGARELLLAEAEEPPGPAPGEVLGPELVLRRRPAARFRPQAGAALLQEHFGVAAVQGLGLGERPAALAAAGALLDYLRECQPPRDGPAPGGAPAPLAHLERPRLYEPAAAMRLDAATVRALALFPPQGRARAAAAPAAAGSLLELLDRCRTAAGKRLLRRRLERPLLELAAIEQRQERLALLRARPLLRARLREILGRLPDLERLLGRVAAALARPAETAALGAGLAAAESLRAALQAEPAEGEEAALLAALAAQLPPAEAAREAIAAALPEAPQGALGEGVLRPGYDAEVDAQRARQRAGREALAALEARERARSGIATLKVGYHRSFGYYLEAGRAHADRAPADWERRQTLAGGERYVSPELRELERELLAAKEALALRERDLYARLCARLAGEAEALRALARGAARLDLDAALAEVSAAAGWTRPRLDRSSALELEEARHPLVEAALPPGRFVPNDLHLDSAGDQVLVVTGPNMAGKSTYLRQAALIALLAQIGSDVPARRARLGLVDRIFARVGAQDDLTAGQSTFMLEMLETAAILAAATPRSLLVLDEIGRGTSTYDGLAIARALLEHLVRGREGPRTLFATHFHELTALAGESERVASASVLVGESPSGEGLRFLYRIAPGAADRSYGVQVAAMAGLPAALLARARELLAALEEAGPAPGTGAAGPGRAALAPAGQAQEGLQPPLLLRDLAALDVDDLTPLDAISALYALRERARGQLPPTPAPPAAEAPALVLVPLEPAAGGEQ